MGEYTGARVTRIVNAWAEGDEAQADEVFELLDRELRAMARRALARDDRMAGEIEPADLIGELFVKLDKDFANNARHFERTEKFLGMVSKVMRNLLLDMGKKGAQAPRRSAFTSIQHVENQPPVRAQVSAPDFYLALDRLEAKAPDVAKAIERHYVFGYTLEKAAQSVGTSRSTFGKRLVAARQWMEIQLGRSP